MICMTGYCLVPGGGFLAAATAAYTITMYDNQMDNGLTYITLLLFGLFGAISSYQTIRLLRTNVLLRAQYRMDMISKRNKLQNVKSMKINRLTQPLTRS